MSRRQIVGVAVTAVLALAFLTAIHLDYQGPFYDELHQTPAAFHYVGRNPILFTWAYHGVPLLNMTYGGAIKSAVYGMMLKYVVHGFTITSWRILGIVFVGAGLVGFYGIAGPSLPFESALLFGALLLTDTSVIITTRHDWGPTALALGLRLLFLAIWISLQFRNTNDYKFAFAGFVVGVMIFEKLSSIPLLIPLVVVLLTTRIRGQRSLVAALAGLFLGMIPLMVANVATYRLGQGFISLSDAASDKQPLTLHSLRDFASNYLSLGQGEIARVQVLGEFSNSFLLRAESLLLTVALLVIVATAIQHRGFSAILAITYFAIAGGLLLLPRATFNHHWIIGTPFQYAAIALALPSMKKRPTVYKMFLGVVIALIVLRLPTLVAVEQSLIAGKASDGFDPAFNHLVRFAANHVRDAVFISSDWGSATQLYCGSNGADDAVFEPFWSSDPGQRARDVAGKTSKRMIYVVTTGLDMRFADASTSIVNAMMTSPSWQNVPVDEEFASLGHIRILKFIRV